MTLSREELLSLRERIPVFRALETGQDADRLLVLVDEALRLRDDIAQEKHAVSVLRAERDALAARAEAGEGLLEYVQHKEGCPDAGSTRPTSASSCACRLFNALARWEATREQSREEADAD